jgi:hypothetical protein
MIDSRESTGMELALVVCKRDEPDCAEAAEDA